MASIGEATWRVASLSLFAVAGPGQDKSRRYVRGIRGYRPHPPRPVLDIGRTGG
jgi:hypothetical protein